MAAGWTPHITRARQRGVCPDILHDINEEGIGTEEHRRGVPSIVRLKELQMWAAHGNRKVHHLIVLTLVEACSPAR